MTEATPEHPRTGIDDDQLPEDLQPDDDNPLAAGLEPGETVGDLLADGKHAEQDAHDGQTGDRTGDQTGDQPGTA